MRRTARLRGLAFLCLACAGAGHAASLNPLAEACAPGREPSAAQMNRLLHLADAARRVLAQQGNDVDAALIARSGLDLSRIGHRYSHAGIALRHNPASPWAVRQLYYTCDERRPHVYDQGLAGFAVGAEQPGASFLSIVLLPAEAASALARQAQQAALANGLLGERYSANAYAGSLRDQNCNQWVAELLAYAWRPPPEPVEPVEPVESTPAPPLRAAAQAALQAQGYQASVIQASPPLRLAALFIPWLHDRDHPPDEVAAGRYRVSMPASLQAWALRRWPTAQAVELCAGERHIVLRRGGEPLHGRCVPEPGDELLPLNP